MPQSYCYGRKGWRFLCLDNKEYWLMVGHFSARFIQYKSHSRQQFRKDTEPLRIKEQQPQIVLYRPICQELRKRLIPKLICINPWINALESILYSNAYTADYWNLLSCSKIDAKHFKCPKKKLAMHQWPKKKQFYRKTDNVIKCFPKIEKHVTVLISLHIYWGKVFRQVLYSFSHSCNTITSQAVLAKISSFVKLLKIHILLWNWSQLPSGQTYADK